MRLSISALALATALAADCVRPMPPPAPLGDAAAAPPSCSLACRNLSQIGCSEGLAANCVPTCEHAAGLTDMHLDCLVAAKSADDARLCHSVRCQP